MKDHNKSKETAMLLVIIGYVGLILVTLLSIIFN